MRNGLFENTILLINDAVQQGIFPCAGLDIGNKTGSIFRYWTGNRSIRPARKPIQEDTLFDLASVTKIVATTTLALIYIQQGKFCLGDKIERYLSTPYDKKKITIFHLMTHTSGIPSYTSITEDVYSGISPEQAVLDKPLSFSPGKGMAYSCLGFILLGRILEIIGGKSLDLLYNEMIFIPLKMKSTCFQPSSTNIASTLPLSESTELFPQKVHDYNARAIEGIAGNAGLFSNLHDLSIFTKMLVNNGQSDNGFFLSQSIIEKATKNYTPNAEHARGIGFLLTDNLSYTPAELFSQGSFGHTGYTGTSLLIEKRRGYYVILLTNRTHTNSLNDEILRFRRILHNCIVAEMDFQNNLT